MDVRELADRIASLRGVKLRQLVLTGMGKPRRHGWNFSAN